jgi:hypothetical protein
MKDKPIHISNPLIEQTAHIRKSAGSGHKYHDDHAWLMPSEARMTWRERRAGGNP